MAAPHASAAGLSGTVARYDTQAAFGVATSWATFDAVAVANAAGFGGATFDGRYAYFVPMPGRSDSDPA